MDLLFRNATIVDGTGAPSYPGDVAVADGIVCDVGRLEGATAARVVDARGKVVAPGFIDIHSHQDLYLPDQDVVARFGSFVRQGVTTCVVGNCGWTLAPVAPENEAMLLGQLRSMGVPLERLPWRTMAQYLAYVERQGLLCNIAQLCGHGAVRIAVMGEENRFCTADELGRMRRLVAESMDAGCVGLSTGLMYYPGMYAHTDELVELAKVAAARNGRYATHLRGYCATLPQSTAEAIEIAEKAGLGLQISHLHLVPFFGRAADLVYRAVSAIERINSFVPLPGVPGPELESALEQLHAAEERGVDVGVDMVPYTLGNTTATVLFPPWANKGGKTALLRRLADPPTRARIGREMRTTAPRWPHWEDGSWSDPYVGALGWKPIRVLSVQGDANRWTEGRSFDEIARVWKVEPFEALCRLVLEEDGQVTFTFGYPARPWSEKIFNPVMADPLTSPGADSLLPAFGTPPPSASGCFPRVLGHYSRELGLLPLEEAVHRMTGLAARRNHLRDRGELRRGACADLVVFDPATVGDQLDADGRPLPPRGLSHVVVNGMPVVWDGALETTGRPGQVLRA